MIESFLVSDLYFSDHKPTSEEVAAVAPIIERAGGAATVMETERLVRGGKARAEERRHLLLPALHTLQKEVGWISRGGLNHVSESLGVPPAEAYGVATFYHLFATTKPETISDAVHVCVDPACRIEGADRIIADMRAAGTVVHESPCLGQCERAPAQYTQALGAPDHAPDDNEVFQLPQHGDASLRLLRRVGVVDATSLDAYREHGGYEALSKAVAMGADAVLDEITNSGLMGRGGAAFPTGVKWRAVAGESTERGPKHIVCNADESEPGTFKDRILMEHDPFSIIEAMTIAAHATGATKGWFYIRGEYPLATERIANAIEAARAAGLLGSDIAGSGVDFDIELRRGAGAYICGEETALFNSIEGFRGEPRNKPPYPTTNGLFDLPTAINNVETLANVLDIIDNGAEAFVGLGTERSSGTKLFCLSGRVANPGLYEVPFGATLGDLINLAGGVSGDGNLQAVLLGGAAGSFVTADSLDLPLTFEAVREAGVSLGSGVIMVFDGTVDMADTVARILDFFKDETCGQCVPCRVGTTRQSEALVRLRRNGTDPAPDLGLIADMGVAMRDSSICGLGHTASTALESALALGLINGIQGQPA